MARGALAVGRKLYAFKNNILGEGFDVSAKLADHFRTKRSGELRIFRVTVVNPALARKARNEERQDGRLATGDLEKLHTQEILLSRAAVKQKSSRLRRFRLEVVTARFRACDDLHRRDRTWPREEVRIAVRARLLCLHFAPAQEVLGALGAEELRQVFAQVAPDEGDLLVLPLERFKRSIRACARGICAGAMAVLYRL